MKLLLYLVCLPDFMDNDRPALEQHRDVTDWDAFSLGAAAQMKEKILMRIHKILN